MGKTITLAPWAGPARMTCHSYTDLGGNAYDCYNVTTAKIRNTIGGSSNQVSVLNKLDQNMNRYSPFHPGNKNINGVTKILELSEDAGPFGIGEFAGYMHSAEEPYVITGGVTFTPAGTVNFQLAFDLGDVDWPEVSELSAGTHVHIFRDNGTTAYEIDHVGSGEILSANPLVISCTDTLPASNTTKTYYVWFGGASATSGKVWRPVNNTKVVTFTYLAPTYLRRCYFDCTGVANSTIGLGAYTKDTYADQAVEHTSDSYTADGVVPWYLQASPSQPVQLTTGNVDFYARKNDGAWTQIASRQNVAAGDPIIISGASLPFTIDQYSDIVDILIRVAGQTLTPTNQGYCSPSDGEPG